MSPVQPLIATLVASLTFLVDLASVTMMMTKMMKMTRRTRRMKTKKRTKSKIRKRNVSLHLDQLCFQRKDHKWTIIISQDWLWNEVRVWS